ncbi:ribonuclease P protein component [Streptococcus sciuri]|uniref:Ribonuclease P protein component n=1 Tax=Streptococcus sciuri TaxID=2973939 RepID=A0ABT2F5Y0_9STRE|nr:ribonuclease P protein component [Streptococcus sciuri]MCS4487863.1 ribonuclease P protein component [Streptococcus sciuri]
MKKTYRVKSDKDFQRIFHEGRSVANRKFVIYHLKIEQKNFRVGLSVSKKLGNAVARNRIKRCLRHILQEAKPFLMPEDFVVIARSGVEQLNYHEMKKNLLHVLRLATIYQEGIEGEKKR